MTPKKISIEFEIREYPREHGGGRWPKALLRSGDSFRRFLSFASADVAAPIPHFISFEVGDFILAARKTPPFRAGMESAASEARLNSTRCPLLLDVLANDGDGCSTAASGKIAWRPQCSAPQLLTNSRILLLTNHPA